MRTRPSSSLYVSLGLVGTLTVVACSAGEVLDTSQSAISTIGTTATELPHWTWESLDGGLSTDPALVHRGALMDAFATAPDGHVYQLSWDSAHGGGSTSRWNDIGSSGHILGPPAAAPFGSKLEVFAIEARSGHLFHQELVANQWNAGGWEDLGGSFLAGEKPTVLVADGYNGQRPQIVALARSGDGHVHMIHGLMYGLFEPWVDLGGDALGPPAITSYVAGRLDIVATAADKSVVWKFSNDAGKTWTPSADGWSSLGGSGASAPALVASGQGRLDLFVTDTDGYVTHNGLIASTWLGWERVGTQRAYFSDRYASPTAISLGFNKTKVFVQGSDQALWDATMTPTTGFDWKWSPFEQLADCMRFGGAASVVSTDNAQLDLVVTGWRAGNTNAYDDYNAAVWHDHFGSQPIGNGAQPPTCCGNLGQQCCGNSSCSGDPTHVECRPGSSPNNQTLCWPMGILNFPCGPNNSCDGSPAVTCFKGICSKCSSVGDSCCGGNTCMNYLLCTNGRCTTKPVPPPHPLPPDPPNCGAYAAPATECCISKTPCESGLFCKPESNGKSYCVPKPSSGGGGATCSGGGSPHPIGICTWYASSGGTYESGEWCSEDDAKKFYSQFCPASDGCELIVGSCPTP